MPRSGGADGGAAPSEGPPEIERILGGRTSEVPPPSSVPESGSGATRRRSRRTVKIPNDAVPQSAAPTSLAAPSDGAAPAAALPAAAPPAPALADGAEALRPPPAIPVTATPLPPRPAPTVPRPVPRASPSVPSMQAAPAPEEAKPATPPPAPPPPSVEEFEVIRPMRIINIGTSPPSVPAPAMPAAEGPDPVPWDARERVVRERTPTMVDDAAWDDGSEKRSSRPPLAASPEIHAFGASPIPPAPQPPKPPVIEEVEAIEEVEEHAADATPRGARTDEIEPIPIDEIEEHTAEAVAAPDAARADEIEPIHVETEDEPEAAERISDFDIAASHDLGGEASKPKKPPPPPPKRSTSADAIPALGMAGAPGAVVVASAPPPASARPVEITPPAPPVAPPPPPAAPPPAVVTATAAPAVTTAPAAPVSSAAAASPAPVQTVDLNAKKRQKPWWEEIFSDDYIRTMERVEPRVVRKECDFIEDRLGLEKGAVMLDLACGAGMHAVELASRGYNVVGYDLSLTMLALAQDEAQERGQKINFLQGDMREMAFEEAFDGMYSWSTSFGYFDDEKNLNVLSRIHRGLRKGGIFLLDVINRDYVCPRQPSLVWFEGDGCVCMDEMYVDFFSSRLRVKRTVMFEDGRSRECDYSIRLYGLHELGRMLHDTGFKVVEVTGHPAHPGVFFGSESPRIIVLAERG